jgi:hypothetical protein
VVSDRLFGHCAGLQGGPKGASRRRRSAQAPNLFRRILADGTSTPAPPPTSDVEEESVDEKLARLSRANAALFR